MIVRVHVRLIKVLVPCDQVVGFSSKFERDAADPDSDGRPHFSNSSGKHLYYSVAGGRWLLSNAFTPDLGKKAPVSATAMLCPPLVAPPCKQCTASLPAATEAPVQEGAQRRSRNDRRPVHGISVSDSKGSACR